MPAYLFLWNPKTDPDSFENYERVLAEAAADRPYETRWICPSTRPRKGDIAFMQRTGPKNNGVFASGVVTRGTYDDRGKRVVRLSLDSFLPLGEEVPRPAIIAEARHQTPWMPMASGNVIPEPILQAIHSLWRRSPHRQDPALDASVDVLAEELVGLEGEPRHRLVIHRKRERALRKRKIADALRKHGSLVCAVPGCNFDFAHVYGELGVGYAQVHHLLPLAQSTEARATRLSDLVIVCANCHSMIHRGGECRELTSLIPRRRR